MMDSSCCRGEVEHVKRTEGASFRGREAFKAKVALETVKGEETMAQALGQYQRAIEDYDIAIQLEPGIAVTYINCGRAYTKLGQEAKAEADHDKACSLDSSTPGCR